MRVSGTLVVPMQGKHGEEQTARLIEMLRRTGQQVVVADSPIADPAVPSVTSMNRQAVYELTEYLIKQGYQRIAFLTSLRVESVIEREAGYREAMQMHHLDVPPEYFLEVAGDDTTSQGRQEVDVFLAMRQPPEAIICLHDLIALNVLKRAAERGWKVPEQVAVAGFDDLPQAASSHPPLTTVHQPLYEMGRRAVEKLMEQIQGSGVTPCCEHLRCKLIIRNSTGRIERTPGPAD